MNQTHYNLDLSWNFEDLKLYENQSNPTTATIFTLIAGVTLVLGGIVHRAIFKLLKRIPDRPINVMIFPTLVSITFQHKIRILITFCSITIRKPQVSTLFLSKEFFLKNLCLLWFTILYQRFLILCGWVRIWFTFQWSTGFIH